jgi:poly-beta-1,6-N-acetyl-D-glucosamine synthase
MSDAFWTPLALVTFWSTALLLAYGCAGYPLVMYALGRLRGRRYDGRDILPSVSLIVPAYNEAHVIHAKVENCLQLDYPEDRLEILIASDGSTDGTTDVIRDAAAAGKVRGVLYPERRGKMAVLNDLVRMATGEITVFTDAASMLEPPSLRALVRSFADQRVGCVSGIYRVSRPSQDGQAQQESLYWRYETFVRRAEAGLGTMLGGHGSLYAIRRELFEPLDPGIINDDFVIPLTILLKGFDAIYEPRAVASEDAREMAGFARRIRIMAGNYQQLLWMLRKDGWRRPRVLFQLLSHKGLRVLLPFLMIGLYVSNAALLPDPGYRLVFAAQTGFFLAALLGLSPRARTAGRALIAGPYYVCMASLAALVAFCRLAAPATGAGNEIRWS